VVFTALKFDPLPGPWRTYIPKQHIRSAVQVTRAVRDAVGSDVDILIEVHRRLAPMHAIDLANALAEFEPYWFRRGRASPRTSRHLPRFRAR